MHNTNAKASGQYIFHVSVPAMYENAFSIFWPPGEKINKQTF